MARLRKRRKCLVVIGMASVFLFFSTGCLGSKLKKKSTVSKVTTQAEKSILKSKDKTSVPLYYDFEDVLVPGELKPDRRSTFVYQTAGFSSGVIALSGRVEMNSLISFFENNMAKDNWKFLSSFRSPRSILLFQKQSRMCVIYLTDKEFKVNIEIWVAPVVNDALSGLFK